MLIVVTDRAGKFRGAARWRSDIAASAYPQGDHQVRHGDQGSSAFYVAHNHPSDNYTLSDDADRQLSDAIGRLAKGIAPEYRGIVSVTTRGYAGYSADGVDEKRPIPRGREKHRIRYLGDGRKTWLSRPVINAPEIARRLSGNYARATGIVFLDAQYHQPVFPVNFEMRPAAMANWRAT